MAERLVWIKDASLSPMELDCGHTTERNGRPTPYTNKPPRTGDEWYCELCSLHIVSQLDQELARADKIARKPQGLNTLPTQNRGLRSPLNWS
jgi:hypothetical protein